MTDETLIAVFVDFENLALGVKEQDRAHFRIDLVLKRLLEKGRVVYKRAYCDWSRFRGVTHNLHAHGITMVDIPQNKLSGKNSADIHMVVDALDLAHVKPHINTFALLSGDSDFSPLVSKLKENDKRVIGLGVKNSTSHLLIDSCDEFIYYDDVLRDARALEAEATQKGSLGRLGRALRGRRDAAPVPKETNGPTVAAVAPPRMQAPAALSTPAATHVPPPRGAPEREAPAPSPAGPDEAEAAVPKERQQKGLLRLTQIVRSLERDHDPVWGSMVKQAMRRVYPGFDERYYGYATFLALLEDAQAHDYLDLEYDAERSNYRVRTQPE